jgi:hypothetical protein
VKTPAVRIRPPNLTAASVRGIRIDPGKSPADATSGRQLGSLGGLLFDLLQPLLERLLLLRPLEAPAGSRPCAGSSRRASSEAAVSCAFCSANRRVRGVELCLLLGDDALLLVDQGALLVQELPELGGSWAWVELSSLQPGLALPAWTDYVGGKCHRAGYQARHDRETAEIAERRIDKVPRYRESVGRKG